MSKKPAGKDLGRLLSEFPPARSVPSTEFYITKVLARFPDVNVATDVLCQWARHDQLMAEAFEIDWLDTLPPFNGSLRDRIRSIIDAATRPQPVPQTEEDRARFEEWKRSKRF